MISFLKTVIYEPLYNLLVFITSLSPFIDAGIAVITLTVLVRFIIFPLSKKAILTQQKIQLYQQDLKDLREKYKDDKQKQAEEMLKFYKDKKINPFSTIFLLLVQMPVIISLYLIFLNAQLPEIQLDLLYNFTPKPDEISMIFLGVLDLSKKSILLAVLAGVSSFVQLKLSMPPLQQKKENPSFKDDLARNMNIQMRYFFPFIIGGIAYSLSAIVALYLLTSNLFTIFQEMLLRKDKLRFKKEMEEKNEKSKKTEKHTNDKKTYKSKKKRYGRKNRK
jgi:YidC/Oxa1 family membrane protein insertase